MCFLTFIFWFQPHYLTKSTVNSAPMHCSLTHKFHFSATFSLKMGPTVLFTHLKIILLQYFSIFSFSFQLYPNEPLNSSNKTTNPITSTQIAQPSVAPWTQAHAQLLDPSMSKPMPKLSKTSHFLNLCYNLIFIFKNSIDISTTKNPWSNPNLTSF